MAVGNETALAALNPNPMAGRLRPRSATTGTARNETHSTRICFARKKSNSARKCRSVRAGLEFNQAHLAHSGLQMASKKPLASTLWKKSRGDLAAWARGSWRPRQRGVGGARGDVTAARGGSMVARGNGVVVRIPKGEHLLSSANPPRHLLTGERPISFSPSRPRILDLVLAYPSDGRRQPQPSPSILGVIA